MTELLLTLWALHAAPGYDGIPARVPVVIGLEVVAASTHHHVDPLTMGAVLAAENRSRRYDPSTVGRYNGGGERGLYQIAPDPWKAEVVERCTRAGRRGHHRYSDRAPCLWLEGRAYDDVDLFDAAQNVEAAAIVLSYLRARGREAGGRIDWLARYRCHPRAYRRGRLNRLCAGSVWRVRRWRADLVDERDRARAWLRALVSPITRALSSMSDERGS